MVAQYLLPELDVNFNQLAKIADWKPGYVVWGFPVWKWLMDQGIHITDYDTIDYQAWADNGVTGLKASIPTKEFTYYQENSYDLDLESRRIKQALSHPQFAYIQHTPSWEEIVGEHNKPGVCDITLDLAFLDRKPGFIGHRVVLVEISDSEVIFHDPNNKGDGANRRETIEHFKNAVASFGSPELARYSM